MRRVKCLALCVAVLAHLPVSAELITHTTYPSEQTQIGWGSTARPINTAQKIVASNAGTYADPIYRQGATGVVQLPPVGGVTGGVQQTAPIRASAGYVSIGNASYNLNNALPAVSYSQSYTQNPLAPLSLGYKAFVIADAATGETLQDKNADAVRSIASISKLMTAMVILDSQLDMQEPLTVIGSDLVGAKVASTVLKADDVLTREELLLLMVMKSDNTAAKTLARTHPHGYHGFIALMNSKARSLGMSKSSFADSSGLDPRNVSTANELVKMMHAAVRYPTLVRHSTTPRHSFFVQNARLGGRTLNAQSTTPFVRTGDYPINLTKTGFIRESGYSVVMHVQTGTRSTILVGLGAPSTAKRWSDAKDILLSLAHR